MLLIGKTDLARGLPMDLYAFPDLGVPNYSPIGSQLNAAFGSLREGGVPWGGPFSGHHWGGGTGGGPPFEGGVEGGVLTFAA
jgi:hypothetical protein